MYITNKNIIIEAAKNNYIEKLYFINKEDIIFLNKFKDIKLEKVNLDFLKKINKEDKNINFIAKIKDYNYKNINEMNLKESNDILILDNITDPHNFGSILRSAIFFNFKNIVIKKKNNVKVNKTVLETSMGAALHANIYLVSNLTNFAKQIKKNNYWIIGTDLKSNSNSLYENKYDFNKALILGSESKGISNLLAKEIDFNIKIPGTNFDSLNVSVAGSIIMSYLYNKK